LAIISNTDDDLFAYTAKLLEVPFDFVTTPSAGEDRGKQRLRPSRSAGLHHDIEPTRALGIHSVWVNRRKGRPGGGATVKSSAKLEVPDLKTLADFAGC